MQRRGPAADVPRTSSRWHDEKTEVLMTPVGRGTALAINAGKQARKETI